MDIAVLVQVFNIALLVAWPITMILALSVLWRQRRLLPDSTVALWTLVILFLPVLGSIAFLLFRPKAIAG